MSKRFVTCAHSYCTAARREGFTTCAGHAHVLVTPDCTDPITERGFDGYFDDCLPCGCVVFYHGGRVLCEDHGWHQAKRLMQEYAAEIDEEAGS